MTEDIYSMLKEPHFKIVNVDDSCNISVDLSEEFMSEFAKHMGDEEFSNDKFNEWFNEVLSSGLKLLAGSTEEE